MTLYEKAKEMSKSEFINLLIAIYNDGFEDGNKLFPRYASIPNLVDMDYEKFKHDH